MRMPANPNPFQAQEKGKLAENILYFSRILRDAGMRVGPASTVEAVQAIETCGITSRDDFYWTLHSTMVKKYEDRAVFDEAFRLFWRSRDLVEKMLQMFSPVANPAPSDERQRAAQSRVAQSLFGDRETKQNVEQPEIEIDARFTTSQKEILRRKDFAQMTALELAQARVQISKMELPFARVKTRRYVTTNRVRKIDMRKTLAASLRTGGDLLLPKFREPSIRVPPVVILADISGSMSQYSRLFLHFFHALSEKQQRIHTFLFGTRLTNITRQLRHKDPDQALAECSDAVADWSGGTRIGSTLAEFNHLWSRRVLGQGAVVLLITDGLERGDDNEPDMQGELGKQMDRLHRSCRRLIWLNPLLRYDEFEARASGIKTMLPHVDEFRAVHSLEAISELCAALSITTDRNFSPSNWLKPASHKEPHHEG